MRFVWWTALKDFQRQRRSPADLALWFGMPLLICTLLVLSMGGRSGPRPQAQLLVADQDDSALSRFLLTGLSQDASGSFIRAEQVELEAGRKRLQKGKASALLVIPAGFSDAVLAEKPCTLRLVTNPAQRILPGIVEESLRIFADAVFYLHRVVGDELRRFAGGPAPGLNTFPDAQIAGFSVSMNRLVDRVTSYLNPLAIELVTTTDEAEKEDQSPQQSYALLFLPGLLFMSLLFMSQGLSEDLWRERSQKTLRRVVISPGSVTQFLAGKALYGVVLMACTTLLALTIGFFYFELPASVLPLAVAWSTFSGTLLLLIMMTLQLHVSSQRAGNIVSMSLIFPLMMVGGSFFPFEAMPDWMAKIGGYTPNGWAVQQLKAILSQKVQPQSLGLAFSGMLVVGGILFLSCARRLRRGFAQG